MQFHNGISIYHKIRTGTTFRKVVSAVKGHSQADYPKFKHVLGSFTTSSLQSQQHGSNLLMMPLLLNQKQRTMKNLLFLVPISVLSLLAFTPSEINSIRGVVEVYAKAGDEQDVKAIEKVMHDGFRVVWNDPGKNTVSLISKADYVQLLGAKKIGGDKRKVIIESIDISEGINASVRLTLDGEKGDFWNLLSLVKVNGEWLIAQDLVTAKFGG